MTLLILSVGTRNRIVRYFRQAFAGDTVIAADASPLAPALYEADRFYRIPRLDDPTYTEALFELCRRERVTAVLSLIDPELSVLAANAERLRGAGVTVVGSSFELCERSLDKMKMYRWLKAHGYACADSWDSAEEFNRAVAAGTAEFPVIVKPVRGSASESVLQVNSRRMLDVLPVGTDGLMIQSRMTGQEIGADVYVDLISGETVSVFTKKKLRMRAGETDKSVSFRDGRLFALIERFVAESGFRGPLDIDLFEQDGEYLISEVNPRFGGGYPHACECGCDHMRLIRNNLSGIANPRRVGDYEEGVTMMKYSEVMIRKE